MTAYAQKELSPEELLKIIFDYTAKIASERQLNAVLVHMADMGRELILSDRCTVWLIDEENKQLYTTVAHGVDEIRIPYGTGFVGSSIVSGNPSLLKTPIRIQDIIRRMIAKPATAPNRSLPFRSATTTDKS